MSSLQSDRSLERILADPIRQTLVDAVGSTRCHLVGGAIRDRLALGIPATDWDLVIRESGEAVAGRLAEALSARLVHLGGGRFTAYRLVIDGGSRVIDLWDRQGTPLPDELARRDLTLNSIALDLASGDVIDPLDGRGDIAACRLRANAPERFVEDPVRTLRLLRFFRQLPGFEIDRATGIAARQGAVRLEAVAAERVRQELDRILTAPIDSQTAHQMSALGLFPRLWDESAGEDCSPRPVIGAAQRLERLLGVGPGDPTVDSLVGLHHALLVSSCDAAPEVGAIDATEAARSGRLSRLLGRRWIGRAAASLAVRLIRSVALPTTDQERRLFIHRQGPEWALVATMAAQTVSTPEADQAAAALFELAAREGSALLTPPRLLDGHDLEREFGLAAGPRMGTLLRQLGEAQAVGSVTTPDQARRWMADRLSETPEDPAT